MTTNRVEVAMEEMSAVNGGDRAPIDLGKLPMLCLHLCSYSWNVSILHSFFCRHLVVVTLIGCCCDIGPIVVLSVGSNRSTADADWMLSSFVLTHHHGLQPPVGRRFHESLFLDFAGIAPALQLSPAADLQIPLCLSRQSLTTVVKFSASCIFR